MNVAFLVLAISGLYLWWPRKWSREAWRAITAMRFNLKGKARDWNWHNAVGFWTAPILIVLTLTAMPISYRWAGDLIYKVTGSTPPTNAPSGGGQRRKYRFPPMRNHSRWNLFSPPQNRKFPAGKKSPCSRVQPAAAEANVAAGFLENYDHRPTQRSPSSKSLKRRRGRRWSSS